MKKIVLTILCFSLFSHFSIAQLTGGGGEAFPDLKTNMKALKKWQDMRFGMFIHWGPVALRGTEIGWSRGREIPYDEYDNLYKEFNPVLFDAAEWVRIAKEAGMNYIVITSKHHDGFCLWDSKYTEYDMASTPYGKDILKLLKDECQKQGILFCTYYSILDWYHPDYPFKFNRSVNKENAEMARYIEYMKDQIKELIEDYQIQVLWFDGEWEEPWTHEEGMKLYKYARDLKDDILINNRVDKGRRGMQGMTESGKFAGDFGTPEQEIGGFNNRYPWESCITICNQWAWKPNDQMKSLETCLHTLIKTAGGDGNLLLNVGPMMNGRIEQRQVKRLREMGDWLKLNGESIYGTRGGPIKPDSCIVSTHKGNFIYIHILNWPGEDLRLPALEETKIKNTTLMNGQQLIFSQSNMDIRIRLHQELKNILPVVIKLELNKPAKQIEPVSIPSQNQTGF